MGVLTDIVVADSAKAADVASDPDRLRKWPGVDAKGIDSIKLARLWALLSKDPSKENAGAEFEVVYDAAGDDGPWVFRVPEPLVQLIAALDEASTTPVATAWGKSEEFILDGWDADAVRSVLSDLQKLARQAVSRRHALLMWMSL